MAALDQRSKKQRAAPPQRDKRTAVGEALDDDDATAPRTLAVELRTDGYRVAAGAGAPHATEAKRARGAAPPPPEPPAFGDVRPYGTDDAAALLRALDRRVVPRALVPGGTRVVRLCLADRRPGGGALREVVCRVGSEDDAEPVARGPPRQLGALLPRRSLLDALDNDASVEDSDASEDAAEEEIVVAETPRRVDVVEEEEDSPDLEALRARLSLFVNIAREHGAVGTDVGAWPGATS